MSNTAGWTTVTYDGGKVMALHIPCRRVFLNEQDHDCARSWAPPEDEGLRAALEEREYQLAMALMELGKVSDPRVDGVRRADVRKIIAQKSRPFRATNRALTRAEVVAALAAVSPLPQRETADE